MNEKVKKQLMALLQAAQQGDQKAIAAIQQIQQQADQGDQQAAALVDAMNVIAKQMQTQQTQQPQRVMARLGTKLNYIRTIKGDCPEGQEVEYFKQGGLVCKKCVEKGAAGAKAKSTGIDAVKEFKKKKACGGTKVTKAQPGSKMMQLAEANKARKKAEADKKKEEDKWKNGRVIVGKDIQRGSGNDTSEQEKKDKSAKDYYQGKADHEVYNSKARTYRTGTYAKATVQKCGGKAKKHEFGGVMFPIYQQGGSFKDAWNAARKNKVRYFNWNGRMYNSKDKGNDVAYQSFRDNMNEVSAQLPTDKSPKHLGWDRNNPLSNELRGKDREIYQQGTESVLPGITVIGTRRQSTKKQSTKKQPAFKVAYNVPMGAIEYVGRDGKQYWMRQDHSNGQYYYIDRYL